MADYKIYIEFNGYPLYADITLDDDLYSNDDDVWYYVQDNIIIDIEKEES